MADLRLALQTVGDGWRATLGSAPPHDVPGVWQAGRRLPQAIAGLSADTAAGALAVGEALWAAFLPGVQLDALALTIEADADDPALGLPWPLLARDGEHLLARPGASIVRAVRGGPALAVALRSPLRVLFVVADSPTSAHINAGAEYLGLLRRLDAAGLALDHAVRVRPALGELEALIASWQPDVVHWIGHGSEASLELPGDDLKQVTPERLAALCGPRIVVLNACSSGGDDAIALPLAQRVVAAGVPVAVGMRGRVKDRACRLFTWQLYRSLAAGEPLAAAVSAGRRAGLVDQPDRLAWAHPALFMGQGVTVATAPPAAAEAAIRLAFQPGRPWFCGRFRALAASTDLGAPARPGVLLLRAGRASGDDRMGLTWLLAELAGRLAAAGRAPVRLLFGAGARDDVPSDLPTLARGLERATRKTREDLGLPTAPGALRAFQDACPTLDPRDITDEFTRALRADLGALADDSGRQPVVLLDDVHLYGALARSLLADCFGAHGLGTLARPLPVVAGFVESIAPEHAPAVDALKSWLETATRAVRLVDVAAFEADEAQLAYQQFLLAQAVPLALTGQADGNVLQLLGASVQGVPSRLKPSLGPTLAVLRGFGWLEEADDDARLKGLV